MIDMEKHHTRALWTWLLVVAVAVTLAVGLTPARAQTEANGQVTFLLRGVTTVSEGAAHLFPAATPLRTHLAKVVGTGAVTATVLVKGSNDCASPWVTLGTITLSGTTSAADSFVSDAPWPCLIGEVTAITGTGAAVTLTAGR